MSQKQSTQKLEERSQGYFTQNYSVVTKGTTHGYELPSSTQVNFYGKSNAQPAIETINEMLTKLKSKFPKMEFLDDGDRRVRITIPSRRERIVIYYDMNNPTMATRIEGYITDKYKNSISSFVWISLKEYQQIKSEELQN